MKDDLAVYNSGRTESLAWLRNTLAAMLEVSPLSYQQKKETRRFLQRMPDWLMTTWANALNIDYANSFKQYPDIAEQAKSETGRLLAQQYLESHDAVATANILDGLVRAVIKQANENNLPVGNERMESQICSLSLAGCTDEGKEYIKSVGDILGDSESPNHPIVKYHLALANKDTRKIDTLDNALAGGRYGNWVKERLTEVKRFLGIEPPHFNIHHGERSPQWDLLWQRIFTGGDDN
jgi:hypothetical protein